ncbi:caspase family protein [Ascidiaceihabitans sp.]|nr:caspase family protein [Ascidiaceihabitans sp.]
MIYFKAIFFAFFCIFLVASEAAAASYRTYSVGGYNNTSEYRTIDITIYGVRLNANSNPVTVQFELHSHKSYRNKTYLEVSQKTFQSSMPVAITWKQKGNYYIHGGGGDPVSVRKFSRTLTDVDKNILSGVCQFLTDRRNLDEIYYQAIDGSSGDQKKYWERYRKRMIGHTQTVGKHCLQQVGGTKVVFSKEVKVCNQNKSDVRLNQKILQGLGLYTSTIDGVSGPNYRRAVTGGEKLLRQWEDGKTDCLGELERKALEAVVEARKRGSSCEVLPNSKEIKDRLQSVNSVQKHFIDHDRISGLIWMISSVSELEMRLSFLNFYAGTKTSSRDCRLDVSELKALMSPGSQPEALAGSIDTSKNSEPVKSASKIIEEPTCDEDPSLCSVVQLCERASYVDNGVRRWSDKQRSTELRAVSLRRYVEIAKGAGLSCGVEPDPVVLAKVPNCEEKASVCSLAELCEVGTFFADNGKKAWRTDISASEHVTLAKQQGVSCGVMTNTVTSAAIATCEANPSACSLAELCRTAISFKTGSLSWSTDTALQPHVEFAQNAGISCGIPKPVVASNIITPPVDPVQVVKTTTLGKYTNRKALVIGNSQYSQQTPLRNPSSDAAEIARSLEEVGFEVELALDLTRRELGRAITRFSSNAKEADISLFYFAGHGIEIDGRNYLVPIDALMDDPSALEYDVIDLQKAIDAAAGSSKLSLVMVDACRDNPFNTQVAGLNRSVSRGLKVIETDAVSKNQIVSFAAESGQVAEDGTDKNSPYAKAFSDLVVQPNLEVGKLFRQLSDSVSMLTNGRQVPVTRTRLSSEDMFFAIER